MITAHKIQVELKTVNTGKTLGKVLLDDVELVGVRGIAIRAGYEGVTEVTITLLASVLATIEGANVTTVKDTGEHGLSI